MRQGPHWVGNSNGGGMTSPPPSEPRFLFPRNGVPRHANHVLSAVSGDQHLLAGVGFIRGDESTSPREPRNRRQKSLKAAVQIKVARPEACPDEFGRIALPGPRVREPRPTSELPPRICTTQRPPVRRVLFSFVPQIARRSVRRVFHPWYGTIACCPNEHRSAAFGLNESSNSPARASNRCGTGHR